jgi:hypothetical protein
MCEENDYCFPTRTSGKTEVRVGLSRRGKKHAFSLTEGARVEDLGVGGRCIYVREANIETVSR